MLDRRQFLITSLVAGLLPGAAGARALNDAASELEGSLAWNEFQSAITRLASMASTGQLETDRVSRQALQLLARLDIADRQFLAAMENAFESGNNFWLWQRLMKDADVNGGILTISRDSFVQLHDHPGATGVLRILSGEAEVWQFDQAAAHPETAADQVDGITTVELQTVSREILRPGDLAILTPTNGNIHALQSISDDCRMLDFFIPPYQRSQRSWYEPTSGDWKNNARITCRKIPQLAYEKA